MLPSVVGNFSRRCARAASSLFAALAAPKLEQVTNRAAEMKDANRAKPLRFMALP
jgi:hypothetical protein